jgi:hypothetical protein
MVSTSFFADGEIYDSGTVTSNDNPASPTASQSPSSLFAGGGVVGEGTVVSNETGPGPQSQAPSSFFADGAVVDTDAVESNDNPGNNAASQAPSSFFQSGNLYDYLSEESAVMLQLAALTDTTTANAASASSSASQASTSEANAAASAASAAAAVQSAAGTATPLVDGTASVGSSPKWAHEDHRHPTDTSRASVTYVDTQLAPKADKSYVDTQDAAQHSYTDTQVGTKVSKTGDTMTGALTVTSGGIWAYGWGGNTGTGVVFLNSTGSRYVYYDGTQYSLPGAAVLAGNGRLWGASDFSYIPQAPLGYTPVNKAGDTITGGLTVNGELVAVTNYIRFGASGSAGYLIWGGGSSYSLGGAGTIWHTGNLGVGGFVVNGRLVYAGDHTYLGSAAMAEPFGGTVVTGGAGVGFDGSFQNYALRHRYMQLQNNAGTWFTIGYV